MNSSSDDISEKPIRVLSIDGGGMRGIVPATILEAMEQETGEHIAHLFDVMVGTSTGSILSLGLNVPNEQGAAKYKATDFVDMYKDLGGTIFHQTRKVLKILDGMTQPTYDPSGYEKLLEAYFGDASMADMICEVAAPSIELEDMNMHTFTKKNAQQGQEQNYYVRDVIRAATAAPTYFPSATLKSLDGSNSGTFVDAGVSTNNPGLLAIAEAELLNTANPYIFVSLGTGAITKPIDAIKARTWGELQWIKSIFDLQGDAQSSYTENVIQKILAARPHSSYQRIQLDLHGLPTEMDDTKPAHLDQLRSAAQSYVADNHASIKALCARLTNV